MFIRKALICAKHYQTDDELKPIMATHPWAGALMYGFFRREYDVVSWEEHRDDCCRASYDAIWVDEGIAAYDRNNKWAVKNFDAPEPNLRLLLDDAHWDREQLLERAWWKATQDLIFHCLPDDYRVHIVYYGEIVDEFGGDGDADLPDPETAWRDALLEYFSYAPDVAAALGPVPA
jgi:hypothetical protein